MEATQETSPHSTSDVSKVNTVSDNVPAACVETDLCHKSNGVAESIDADNSSSLSRVTDTQIIDNVSCIPMPEPVFTDYGMLESSTVIENSISNTFAPETEAITILETNAAVENLLSVSNPSTTTDQIELIQKAISEEEVIENCERSLCNVQEIAIEEPAMESDSVDASNDKVTFETEVLVEKNDNDTNSDLHDCKTGEHDHTNNILSELGQGIELSEVLRSSDTTDNNENNNGGREEVFNKEELLDILEGNDVAAYENEVKELLQGSDSKTNKTLEAQIAMNQLTRLKQATRKRKTSKRFEKPPRKKRDKRTKIVLSSDSTKNKISINENTDKIEKHISNAEEIVKTEDEACLKEDTKKNDSIVNVLVKDWEDDDPSEIEQASNLLQSSDTLLNTNDKRVKSQEIDNSQEGSVNRISTDSPADSINKNTDDGQPQRRLGRVIKKKVIFDPDNPDTFTKGKIVHKIKEVLQPEKEQSTPKKNKVDQISPRSKSKSPLSKLSWKKPPPRNTIKQNRRLTEVDKLLMDEGAVNMIYQLTPEAPKGKKNMKTKAEFIKKLQSSTPDGKEMKFRERKKEARAEEEAKKILGGKQRSSLSGSVKSPSVCEDLEAHSADDSIIYRRHSSSSYSSTCMSPRRLSDVDAVAVQSTARASRKASDTLNNTLDTTHGGPVADIFMADASDPSCNEIINKDDCLSIKEKLNTKLSLALKKRKRESAKADKPLKQKKSSKNGSIKSEQIDNFKYLSITFDQRLAEICIHKSELHPYIEVLRELEQALVYVDNKKDISVTLLTSDSGTLSLELDLTPLLEDNMEKRTNYAYEIAESVRMLLYSVDRHNKIVVAGIWGACSGLSLSLVALSDMVLASESATFAVGATPLLPGVSVLAAGSRKLPHALINDLVVLERRLSAAEALQGGLVSRTLYPLAVYDQVRAIAADIAAQPLQSLLLKKQLLSLAKGGVSQTTFLLNLERERDLLVQYWTSIEGQEVIRRTLDTA